MPHHNLDAFTRVLLVTVSLLFFAQNASAQDEAMGSGAGWFDCNNDGHLDLAQVTPDGDIRLFIFNAGSQKFDDHSDTAFPSAIQGVAAGLGVVCGDANNDGLPDLLLTFDGANRLLLNNGDDTFRLAGRLAPGDQGDVMSASAAFLDYDLDGLLDIFIANYEGTANQLFHNEGISESGTPSYIDVAPDMGLQYAENGQSDWSLGVTVADYDNDGDPDLYVANDYDGVNLDTGELNPGPNILYRNDNGTFVDVTISANAWEDGWAMGAAFGDYNNDGWMDIFVTNFWEDALYHNNKNGTFSNVTDKVGIPSSKPPLPEEEPCTVCNGWGTSFIDFDNDGDLDIHVTNGYITNGFEQLMFEPNELWENKGLGGNGFYQFEEVGLPAGVNDTGDGRGAAYGDFNRDGFIDIAVMNNNFVGGSDPVPQELLYVNQKDGTFRDMALTYGIRDDFVDGPSSPPRGDFTGNGWLEIKLVGVTSNRDALGSRVSVWAGGKKWVKDLGTGSYCSTNSPLLHFGLGANNLVDRVTVRFPGGTEVTKTNIPANTIITIAEDDPTPVRLLSLAVDATPEGARVHWSYTDDGEVFVFALRRTHGDETETVAASIKTVGGTGEVLDREVPIGVPITYELDAIYRDGGRETVGSTTFRFDPSLKPNLGQNYPNPFAASTFIPVAASPGGAVEVQIFDAGGRLVRNLRGSVADTGGLLKWDGKDGSGRKVPAGTYFYRLASGNMTLKMIRRP